MPLIKDGRVVDDPWLALADDAPLPPTGPVLVSLAGFREQRDALLTRGAPLGVRLKSAELAAELGADAAKLDLVAIEFPTFRDGRGYSTARLLRERWGFAGELRAVGNVLRDQPLFMHRCGFDAFEVADARAVELWRQAIAEFTVFYQRAADDRVPATQLRHRLRAAE
jgi:uncharacterized protein (DUF934 family)